MICARHRRGIGKTNTLVRLLVVPAPWQRGGALDVALLIATGTTVPVTPHAAARQRQGGQRDERDGYGRDDCGVQLADEHGGDRGHQQDVLNIQG